MAPLAASAPNSVCVLRLSAIGDTCHTLPIVRTLQCVWPQTKITWIIGELEFGLMGDIPDVEFLVFNKRDSSHNHKLKETLRNRHFDILLHMQASMRANLLSRWIKAPIKLGFDKARARDWQWLFTNKKISGQQNQAVMESLFGFVESLGIYEHEPTWNIPLPKEATNYANSLFPANQKVLLISPCSSQRFRNWRNWKMENYALVAQYAKEKWDATTVVTGGHSELEKKYAEGICQKTESAVNLAGKTNLKELLALIKRADVVLCPDSGPAHMATTVATPVIGLYASTNPLRTGPSHSQKWVINKYPEALQQETGRSVSEVRWGKRVRNPSAMDLISVEEVIMKFDELASTLNWL